MRGWERREKEEDGRRKDGENAPSRSIQAWSLPSWSLMLGENKVKSQSRPPKLSDGGLEKVKKHKEIRI